MIDVHNHCSSDGSYHTSAEEMIRGLDRFGIDKVCCSAPISYEEATPELVRKRNDLILGAMKQFPDRIFGQCFLNPGYVRETQDEITRCISDGGMIGVKLYHQYYINEPVLFPLIERCIDLGVSILMHAGWLTAPEDLERQKRISGGDHFADIAQRYPEAMFICGHIGGGGDWERQLKGLRNAPSVYIDTSGSVIDAGLIERCVRELGPARMLFATDGSVARGVGKILDADITQSQRKMIWSTNFLKILARRKA